MVATKEEYQKALLKLRDKSRFKTTKYLDMLRAHYYADDHIITATRLAEEVGYANFNAANLQYGTLGHEVADALGYMPPCRDDGSSRWFWSIASGNEQSSESLDGHYEFVLRPELIAALKHMKWVK